jgi:hypothetical protein
LCKQDREDNNNRKKTDQIFGHDLLRKSWRIALKIEPWLINAACEPAGNKNASG